MRHTGSDFSGLPSNAAHNFAAGYALSHYASDAVYSFIPKNACSTLRYSLALANGAISGPAQFAWIHHNNATFRASLRDLARAPYAFVVLRDPYLRLASCYLDKIVGQTPVAATLERALGYKQPTLDLSFRGFVSQLGPIVRKDEHWRPQADFLVYERYDDVFCVEDFAAAVATLKAKIGFEVQDARALSRHGLDRYALAEDFEDAGRLPAFRLLTLKRAGRVPPPRALYDDETAAKVAKLYADDIALYKAWCGRETLF